MTVRSREAARRLALYRRDAQAWASDVLGQPFSEPQMQIVEPVQDPRAMQRIIAKSCNGAGKTNAAAKIVLWWNSTRRGFIVTTAPTWPQVRDKLWQEMSKLYNASRKDLGGTFLADTCRWKMGDYWQAVGTASKDASSIQGGHSEHILIVFDEAQGVRNSAWEGAEGMMVADGAKWVAIGNPLTASGEFYQAFRRPHEWHGITIDALEHPNVVSGRSIYPGAVTRAWVDKRREIWGEEDNRWLARVRGQFPVSGGSMVVSIGLLESALKKEGRDPDCGLHLGVDVARFGDDDTVLMLTDGNVPISESNHNGLNGTQVAGLVIARCKDAGIPQSESSMRIHVDSIGVGASVVDALEEEGWTCDPVNFGAGPRGCLEEMAGEIEFKNLRAEAYWTIRELLARGEAHVPEEFGAIWDELIEPEYSYDRSGKLVVEEKKLIKARLGRSPDSSDAYAYALCREDYSAPVIGLGY